MDAKLVYLRNSTLRSVTRQLSYLSQDAGSAPVAATVLDEENAGAESLAALSESDSEPLSLKPGPDCDANPSVDKCKRYQLVQ